MKELSIEEKAKAYDKIVERLKDFRFEYRFSAFGDVIEENFPELKEKESERIRNFISNELACLRATDEKGTVRYNELTEAIAWLEKRGETGTNGNKREIPFATWSEEDENIRQWIIHDINKLLALKKKSFIIADKEINWLKSIKDRVQPQPKQDWSEEDEEMLTAFLHKVEVCDLLTNRESVWVTKRLKSLRPQPQWKPSDEQMLQLGWIAKQNEDNNERLTRELMVLKSKIQDLM